jgi:hypothetical protein
MDASSELESWAKLTDGTIDCGYGIFTCMQAVKHAQAHPIPRCVFAIQLGEAGFDDVAVQAWIGEPDFVFVMRPDAREFSTVRLKTLVCDPASPQPPSSNIVAQLWRRYQAKFFVAGPVGSLNQENMVLEQCQRETGKLANKINDMTK